MNKKTFLLPLLPLVVTMAVAEFLVQRGVVPSYLLPAPSQVIGALFTDSSDLWKALAETSLGAVLGFGLSLSLGIFIGILLSVSNLIQKTFYPYAVFFQTVPIIAIAPLLVIWFGYGMPTVVSSSFIVSIFPVIANTLTGLRSTDPALVDLFTLYKARPWARLFKLRLPAALPFILTGTRVSSGLAVIGAIVGEFIGGGGLGGVVDEARRQQRIDKVFAAVLLSSVLGLVFFGAINFVSRISLKKWHASEKV